MSKAELHAIFNADSGWCVESIAENVMEHHPSFNSEGENEVPWVPCAGGWVLLHLSPCA